MTVQPNPSGTPCAKIVDCIVCDEIVRSFWSASERANWLRSTRAS
jgi:hypothetical protein